MLDLREIALAIQAEQNPVGALLPALHGLVANQSPTIAAVPQQMLSQTWAPASVAPQPAPYLRAGGYAPQSGGIGGMLGSFLNSGFGRAIEPGAGFGIGNDLSNKNF